LKVAPGVLALVEAASATASCAVLLVTTVALTVFDLRLTDTPEA